MKMKQGKKIKIFLGAYVNFPNAQNINCDNIARSLDKERFEVHTMYISRRPIDKVAYREQSIHLHKLIHHRIIWYWSKYLTMLFGNYDIYYLPKMEPMDVMFAKRHHKKKNKVFISSIEGVIEEQRNNEPYYKEYYLELMDASFSISECIANSVKAMWGKTTNVIPLGVVSIPAYITSQRNDLQNVIWVGNIVENKRPMLLLECAKRFPELSFIMLGDGDLLDEVKKTVSSNDLHNVTIKGRVPNAQVYEYLVNSSLLLMTSQYEGLPKVIQEAAQCGVPAIYFNEHYSVDFIQDGVNGYEVNSIEQMVDKISFLQENPEIYKQMREAAKTIIKDYTWDRLITQYEEYFWEQYFGK